ncbi:DEAD/DEAH box helicase [Bacteroides ovatus]|jgi:helicase domain-containing protein|uniref:DEAD/DEAH box helicase n=1 Tax=Bacteroides ovatus TaxID=28116 RepID=A0AAW6HK09_BACOV|nr:DEAD/DEAH box helicase [Bacteroides ovatus]MCS3129391.1 DEAD/DEAH box helicase [Bacteroides ovatus]MDC2708494.1 DEAD/DEAH box helicase [Bacteroides ovatus]MDC2719268.1 DEAD/DEAH box helicase [Bacteroides ovatus]MDC2744000.1 DEAD/DEAH box helicase [Bacteroides ovatus]
MNIELKGDNFELSFKYKPSIVDRVRQIPGRRFDGAKKVWIIPARSRVDLERMIYQIRQFENINWVNGTEKKEEDIAYDIPELPDLTVPHNLKIQPYPYQLKGIARGLQLKRFMNCDEPGLGKTLQSIATINLADAFPCLVVCPSSLKINWLREWEKFTDKKAMILTDKVRDTWTFFFQTGMHQVFIVNYESLKKYFVQRIKKAEGWTLRDVEFRNSINLFKSVIIDESHRCKSASTQQAKFCKGICTGKEWVIELTGTPVVNRPKDLIPQLAILDRMNDFGGYKPFVDRYCSGQREASNLRELNFNLWKYCMFRREKSLVLTDLPDKIRQVNTCEITNRKEYMDAERDLIMYLQKYKDADDDKIAKAMRGEVMVRINILRQISARGKVRDVIEFVKDFRENGKKIILFCSLHEVVDQLKRYFPTAVSVTGRDSQDEKQRAVDAFQNNPKADIIICSIKAAGVGLTLTASSNVAFVEFPWTYADCCQCEDRAHRIGQKDSVTCYYFLGRRTIDEKVYRIIQEKKNIANAVTGSTEDIEENIVDMVARIFDTDYDDE